MSIRTDCWSLDVAFYRWAAKRLTHLVESFGESPRAHPEKYRADQWAGIVKEMRDAFQVAADGHETVWQAPSPRLRRALKRWATELPHLWT